MTSGQPTRESLAALKSEGFDAVIYLAPSDVVDAIADEGEILQAQGIEFVHVPIRFRAPAPADVEQVARVLDRLDGRKVLVHCQVNMRASSVVFLYRAAYRGVDPAKAYESVTRVWVRSPATDFRSRARGGGRSGLRSGRRAVALVVTGKIAEKEPGRQNGRERARRRRQTRGHWRRRLASCDADDAVGITSHK